MAEFKLGIRDGWNSPHSFTSGRTWDDWRKNERYDSGVNWGQLAARLLRR